MLPKIKYLAIGHCCHDKVGDSFILGGTSSYASMLAKHLGANTSLLTSVGDDFLFRNEFESRDIEIHNVKAAETTVFENKYVEGQRAQTISGRAEAITAHDFESIGKAFDVVQVSPIADEVEFDLLSRLGENTLTLATPQGWLRQWDGEGKVSYKEIDWSRLAEVDFVIISEEDVPDLSQHLSNIKNTVKGLIVTKGEKGSVMYANKVEAHFPAYPTKMVDPTGAGDTFATGFIMRYAQTQEVVASMIFANCLASICIEHQGTKFFEHIVEVEQRMEFYKKNLLDLNSSAPMRVK